MESVACKVAYIYGLVDPDTQQVRYIGKSTNPKRRLYAHLSPTELSGDCYRTRWLRRLVNEGKRPSLLCVATVPADAWEDAERYWIEHYRKLGAPLTNTNPGGEGLPKGFQHDDDTKARMSHSRTGHGTTEATRKKIADSLRGRSRPDAARQKMHESHKARWASMSDEERERAAERGRRIPKGTRSPSSGYRGVTRVSGSTTFRAFIRMDGKTLHIGCFPTAIAAAEAYDRKAREVHGERAILNFSTLEEGARYLDSLTY